MDYYLNFIFLLFLVYPYLCHCHSAQLVISKALNLSQLYRKRWFRIDGLVNTIRPVLLTLLNICLNQFGQHHYYWCLMVPHHLPEILHRLRQRPCTPTYNKILLNSNNDNTLSSDVGISPGISLNVRKHNTATTMAILQACILLYSWHCVCFNYTIHNSCINRILFNPTKNTTVYSLQLQFISLIQQGWAITWFCLLTMILSLVIINIVQFFNQ